MKETGLCDNKRMVPCTTVEAIVLKGIEEKLAAPEVIAEYVREYHRMTANFMAPRRIAAATSKSDWATLTARYRRRSTLFWEKPQAERYVTGLPRWRPSATSSKSRLPMWRPRRSSSTPTPPMPTGKRSAI
ncbi:hypothetical protein ACVWZK_001760 [Bradyrhizobium sp. GM0.4]